MFMCSSHAVSCFSDIVTAPWAIGAVQLAVPCGAQLLEHHVKLHQARLCLLGFRGIHPWSVGGHHDDCEQSEHAEHMQTVLVVWVQQEADPSCAGTQPPLECTY